MLAKAKYRKDYQTPDFTVTDIYLDFQLEPERPCWLPQANINVLIQTAPPCA